MDSVVVIHHDNVPHVERFCNRIKFDAPSADIDRYISEEILPIIREKSPKLICIKDNLSDNYMELLGIRVAYHIRLSKELGDMRYVPIMILSDLDAYLLCKIDKLSKILMSKNIFLTANSFRQIEDMRDRAIKPLTEKAYHEEFLSLIHVEEPQDFLSHHAITNEWSIYQWAKMLGAKSEAIDANEKRISSMLYFKYILAKSGIEQIADEKLIKDLKLGGRVLFVDDRWSEGWKDVMGSYLKKIYPNIGYDTLEYNFKDKRVEDIQEALKEKIKSFDADVIVLDLRLLESDDSLNSIKDISGFKIIDTIHQINPGIQIVMFTASGDSRILDELNRKKILGYVKKDAPNERYETETKSFNKLGLLIKEGVQKSYLKEIWNITKEIDKLPLWEKKSEDALYAQLHEDIDTIFKMLDSNMQQREIYVALTIFRCLEHINNIYIIDKEKGKRCYWKDNHQEIEFNKKNTIEKLLKILEERVGLSKEEFKDELYAFNSFRNHQQHSDKKAKAPSIDKLIHWFRLLEKIVKKM